jgi:hypothetical protein
LLRGDRTLTLPAAAKVCQYFGLELCRGQNRYAGAPSPPNAHPDSPASGQRGDQKRRDGRR